MIGWTPDELANHLLAETLEMFADRNSGALEGFLGAIYYPDRESARRASGSVTQIRSKPKSSNTRTVSMITVLSQL